VGIGPSSVIRWNMFLAQSGGASRFTECEPTR